MSPTSAARSPSSRHCRRLASRHGLPSGACRVLPVRHPPEPLPLQGDRAYLGLPHHCRSRGPSPPPFLPPSVPHAPWRPRRPTHANAHASARRLSAGPPRSCAAAARLRPAKSTFGGLACHQHVNAGTDGAQCPRLPSDGRQRHIRLDTHMSRTERATRRRRARALVGRPGPGASRPPQADGVAPGQIGEEDTYGRGVGDEGNTRSTALLPNLPLSRRRSRGPSCVNLRLAYAVPTWGFEPKHLATQHDHVPGRSFTVRVHLPVLGPGQMHPSTPARPSCPPVTEGQRRSSYVCSQRGEDPSSRPLVS